MGTMTLLEVSAHGPLKCKSKRSMMEDMAEDINNPFLNWRLTCSDDITHHVSAFDMASVSPYLKCVILKNQSDGGCSLCFDSSTVGDLLRLLYVGKIRVSLPNVVKLFACADYVSIDVCTDACIDCLMYHLDGCILEDVTVIYDFCRTYEHHTERLLRHLVETIATDFRIDSVADMVPHELLEQVVNRDDLHVPSELVLARALKNSRAWNCLRHVRIENTDDAELGQLVAEFTDRGGSFRDNLIKESSGRLKGDWLQCAGRRQRGTRYVWRFNACTHEHRALLGTDVQLGLKFEHGRLTLWCDKEVDLEVYYGLKFERIRNAPTTFDSEYCGWRYAFADQLAPPTAVRNHFFCVVLKPE